jgi:hypothetical protein
MLSSRFFYVYLVLSIISFGIVGLFTEAPILMAPDSETYLNASLRRTIGYPIFLSIVAWLDSSFSILPVIQSLIYAFAASFLVYSYSRFISNRFFCCFFVIVLSINPIIWIYHSQMLAESLFMSLTMICLGLIVNAIFTKKNNIQLILLGSVIGVMILVKPVGYAYVSVLLFIIFFIDSKKIQTFIKIFIPLLVILILASFKNYYTNGVFATQVFGGYNLLGQVVPIMVENNLEDNQSRVQTKISKSFLNLTNELPESIFSWKKHFYLTAFSYNKGLGDYASPIIFDIYNIQNYSESEKHKFLNKIAWDISLEAIKQNPLSYSRHVLSNILGLWYLPTVTHREELIELKDYFCSDIFNGFFTKDDCEGVIKGFQIPKNIVYVKNLIFTILFLSSLILISFSILRFQSIPINYSFGLFPALMINSHHLLVSLLESGLSRYALATWPLLVALAFFIFFYVLKIIYRKL